MPSLSKWRRTVLLPILFVLAVGVQSTYANHEMFSLNDIPAATLEPTTDATAVSTSVQPTTESPLTTSISTASSSPPAPTCLNDGVEFRDQCYCSSPYIVSDHNQSCNSYECLSYGRTVNSACHCPPGFLGFHCEPVRCVEEQLEAVARPQSLSLYVSWNFALRSSADFINGTIINFANDHKDVAFNIMFNENLKTCMNAQCVARTFNDSMNEKSLGSAMIPISRIQKLIDQSEFQSHLVIWTNVALKYDDSQELSALLQSAIAKRIKISAYVFRPDLTVHKNCTKTGAYLCDDFGDLRRIVSATLGVFLAPYKPAMLATPFVHNQTLSSLSQDILSSQYSHTVLAAGTQASCMILPAAAPEGIADTTQLVVVSTSPNPKDFMQFASGPVTVAANAGRWMLFNLDYPTNVVIFENDFPCYYEIWAVNAKKSINVGFTSNPEADVTSTVPFIALPHNQVLLQYYATTLQSANLTIVASSSNSAVSVTKTNEVLKTRNCQYNYELPYTISCTNVAEFQLMVTLDGSVYTEVVPLYCSQPINAKYFNLFVDDWDLEDGFDLDFSDLDAKTDPPVVTTTLSSTTATAIVTDASETSTTVIATTPPSVCPEALGNRTFALILANYYPMVQQLFNVTESSSLLKPLLTYLNGLQYEYYTVGFLSADQKCSVKSASDLEGFKNNLLNNLAHAAQKDDQKEWMFSACLSAVLKDTSMHDDSDVFILTPFGVGKITDYADVLQQVYNKRAAITVMSQSNSDCEQTKENSMSVMTLSTLSGGFAMCSNLTSDLGGFIESYQKVSNTPSVIIHTEFYDNILSYSTQNFYVAEDSDFIFSTTSTGVSILSVDDSETQQFPFYVDSSVALFNLSLSKGSHNITILSKLSGNVMYKLSILNKKSSELLIGFEGSATNQFPSYGNRVAPLIGGELGDAADLTLNVFTSDNVAAANATFSAEDESECYNQKASATFTCNVDYKIYFLQVSSDNFTTRTYPFACIPSDNNCVNGQVKDGKCVCFPGWIGNECAMPSETGCENGGILVGSSCKCPTGFHGTRCENYSGKCTQNSISDTIRYDSKFESVAIVVEDDFVPKLAADLTDLTVGFARQYTVLRYICNDTDCSICSPSSTTNNQNGFLKLFTTQTNCTAVARDPLEAALNIQIASRSLVIFIGSSDVIGTYNPTNETIALAAKSRAEIRVSYTSGDPPAASSMSTITRNGIVKYDKSYFKSYVNALLPSTESTADNALYVVSRENKDQKLTVEADSTYFITYSKVLTENPYSDSTSVSNQIFVVKTSGNTIDVKASGASYTVEVLSPRKVAFALNRDIYDERRQFALSAGGASYLNFYAVNWLVANGEAAPILTVENTEVMATEKTNSRSCTYLWTSQVSCEKVGIVSVQISYNQFVRTIDLFCVSADTCTSHSENSEMPSCKCQAQWGDIDCSRPTCNGGLLDGTVCNCPLPSFGLTCSGNTTPSAATTTTVPLTSAITSLPTATTARTKSCVSHVKTNLFVFYDASASSIPHISEFKDVLNKFVSDFVINVNASFVSLYDMSNGRPTMRESICSFGANLQNAINGMTASTSVIPSRIQKDLKDISQFVPYTLKKNCPDSAVDFPKSRYALYLTSNDGSGSDLEYTKKSIEGMKQAGISPIMIFFGTTKSDFWSDVAKANPGTTYSLLQKSDSVEVVNEIWTQICRNENVIDDSATAEPPSEKLLGFFRDDQKAY